MRISIASFSFHGLRERNMMDVFGYLESCKYRYGLDSADTNSRKCAAFFRRSGLRGGKSSNDSNT